ncbi:MAG: hypothetical protein H7336_04795 [Bacteriovorax sp.]|nr:hypothetical protein [Bacteriovorax sp.]
MTMSLNRFCVLALLAVVPATSFALPIDWHGAFGVDTTLLSGARRVKSKAALTAANPGSQEVALDAGEKQTAEWQSYIFKLAPTMIINDAATFKGELTTGYANGGYLGDSFATDAVNTNNVPVYYHTQSTGGSNINVRKAFLELYSDTATYQIGRHTINWGLGAVYNDGNDTWDRHSSIRDGVTMKLKIGNFYVSPFWSKVTNGGGITMGTAAKEFGAGFLYDNQERDIAFGLLYTIRNSNQNSPLKTAIDAPYTSLPLGDSSVKITDIYFKKELGKFDVAIEVPLVSGDLGRNAAGSVRSYSAKAVVLQSNYKASDFWTFGFDGGKIAGDDGSPTKFGALYLNPNYQVANILFRYNLNAIGNHAQSIYDSYITNTLYLKLRSSYSTEKWTFDTAVIYAKAEEAATAGKAAYNHTKNTNFTAATSQSKDLGTEIDLNATYKWNNEIRIGGGFGYLITGDYYSYTNNAAITNEKKSSMLIQVNTSVTF